MNGLPKFIAVAGGSCSGKTTLVQHIANQLDPSTCSVVHQDSYYFDHGLPSGVSDAPGEHVELGNFDHPASIDFTTLRDHLDLLNHGEPIAMPVYDFTTHRRTATATKVAVAPIVLIDGTLLLTQEDLRERFTLSVFITCEVGERLARRMRRVQQERGRTVASIRRQFDEQVEPMHAEFVEPSQHHADFIIDQAELDAILAGRQGTLLERLLATLL